MTSGPARAWIIRASDSGMQTQVLSRPAIAVGWSIHRDVSHVRTQEEMVRLFASMPRNDTPQSQANKAGQLYTFLRFVEIGDIVLTPLKRTRTVRVGTINGPYEFESERFTFGFEHPHLRKVHWVSEIARDVLSSGLIQRLNMQPTVIPVHEHIAEISRYAVRGTR